MVGDWARWWGTGPHQTKEKAIRLTAVKLKLLTKLKLCSCRLMTPSLEAGERYLFYRKNEALIRTTHSEHIASSFLKHLEISVCLLRQTSLC